MKVDKASAFFKRELVEGCKESPAMIQLLELENKP